MRIQLGPRSRHAEAALVCSNLNSQWRPSEERCREPGLDADADVEAGAGAAQAASWRPGRGARRGARCERRLPRSRPERVRVRQHQCEFLSRSSANRIRATD